MQTLRRVSVCRWGQERVCRELDPWAVHRPELLLESAERPPFGDSIPGAP